MVFNELSNTKLSENHYHAKKMILYKNCWQILRENDFYAWNERLNTICLKGLVTAQNFLSGWYDQLCMFSKPGSFEISSLQRLQIYTLSKHTQMQTAYCIAIHYHSFSFLWKTPSPKLNWWFPTLSTFYSLTKI